MRRFLVFGLVLSVLMALARQPQAAPADPAEGLDTVLEGIRKKYSLPALGTAVILHGKTESVAAVGVRKSGDPTPVTAEDQFHIGSCTKSMTATMIATLVEDGRLKWKTTLEEAFPDLRTKMQPELKSVTLEQLLANRGGISGESFPAGKTGAEIDVLPGNMMEQRRAYVRMFLSQKPEAPPGTKFIYSNAGVTIAGAAAEEVMRKPWEVLMRERLFRRLEMKSPGFGAMGTPGKVDQPWQHILRSGTVVPIEPGPHSDNPEVIGPAGTVHCSLGDWAKYIAAHLKGEDGGSKLLKAETWKTLHLPRVGWEYAYGWGVTRRDWAKGRALTHNGSNGQNFAVTWLAPDRKFAVLVATNQGGEAADKACDDTAAAMIDRFLK